MMSLHKKLVAKYQGNPMLLFVAAIGFSFSFYGLYKYGYKPWNRRRHFKEAEQYADFIFEKESER